MTKEQRTIEIKIRMNKSEYELLQQKSGNAVFAKWCRNVLLGVQIEPVQPTKHKSVDPVLLREIQIMSNNLNQIAKKLNTWDKLNKPVYEYDVASMLISLQNIADELARFKDWEFSDDH